MPSDLVVAIYLIFERRRTENWTLASAAKLFPQIQLIEQLFVPLGLGPAQIVEQAPALGDHFQEATARGVVFDMALQVFGKLPDPARKQRDLYICAAGVLPVQLELLHIHCFGVLSHFESGYSRRCKAESQPRLEGGDIRDRFSDPGKRLLRPNRRGLMHHCAAPLAPGPQQENRADD